MSSISQEAEITEDQHYFAACNSTRTTAKRQTDRKRGCHRSSNTEAARSLHLEFCAGFFTREIFVKEEEKLVPPQHETTMIMAAHFLQ